MVAAVDFRTDTSFLPSFLVRALQTAGQSVCTTSCWQRGVQKQCVFLRGGGRGIRIIYSAQSINRCIGHQPRLPTTAVLSSDVAGLNRTPSYCTSQEEGWHHLLAIAVRYGGRGGFSRVWRLTRPIDGTHLHGGTVNYSCGSVCCADVANRSFLFLCRRGGPKSFPICYTSTRIHSNSIDRNPPLVSRFLIPSIATSYSK